MRWPERLGVLGLVAAAWLLLPASASAAAGMSMGPANQGDRHEAPQDFAMDCPRCVTCHLAPAPVAKTPSEPDRELKDASWIRPMGAQRPADGRHIYEVRAEAVPLRIAYCKWRD